MKVGPVDSLARPGGNVTGLGILYPEMAAKHVELLHNLAPGLSRIAVLWNSGSKDSEISMAAAMQAAQTRNIEAIPIGVKGIEGFEGAFASIVKAQVGGLTVIGDSMLRQHRQPIVDFATANRLPGVYAAREFPRMGGLASLGVNFPDMFRRAAEMVDKIFKGTRPADIPVEQATKLDLILNLKTANALGLTVPPGLLNAADEVIE